MPELPAVNNWVRKADTGRWDWPKEIAVITGGAAGIGLLVVKGLIARGVRVAVLDVAPLDTSVKSGRFSQLVRLIKLIILARSRLLPEMRRYGSGRNARSC